MVDIIVYGYDFAPNPQKLLSFLAYFQIPYKYYRVSPTMPRPDLASVGVQYRRTPLLSIDSDLYVDNALIIEKLADIAAHSNPDVDAALHLEYDGIGQAIFRLATGLIPTSSPLLHDEYFLADRAELIGTARFSLDAIKHARPQSLSHMMSQLSLIERHFLANDKKFILGGDIPTTADLYLYWSVKYGLLNHEGARPEISPSTHEIIFAWLERVKAFLEPRKREETIDWDSAKEILVRPPRHEYAKFVPHDEDNPLKLTVDQQITVTPVDTGRSCPQHGTLIALNVKQVCLRNTKGVVMHFPRINYTVAPIKQ